MASKQIWSLPAAGLFYSAGVLLRGPFANPLGGDDPQFAARAGAPVFPIAYLLIVVASGLAMVGYVALRDRLRDPLGPLAMILSVVGLHFLTLFFGVMALAYPALSAAYLAGDRGAVQIAAHVMASPFTMAVLGLVSLNVIGHVLFAVSMWRTGWAPKAAIVPFVLATIMQMVTVVYAVEILGCALLAVSGFWIAAAALRLESAPGGPARLVAGQEG